VPATARVDGEERGVRSLPSRALPGPPGEATVLVGVRTALARASGFRWALHNGVSTKFGDSRVPTVASIDWRRRCDG
jgi:hypothetical protein